MHKKGILNCLNDLKNLIVKCLHMKIAGLLKVNYLYNCLNDLKNLIVKCLHMKIAGLLKVNYLYKCTYYTVLCYKRFERP